MPDLFRSHCDPSVRPEQSVVHRSSNESREIAKPDAALCRWSCTSVVGMWQTSMKKRVGPEWVIFLGMALASACAPSPSQPSEDTTGTGGAQQLETDGAGGTATAAGGAPSSGGAQ